MVLSQTLVLDRCALEGQRFLSGGGTVWGRLMISFKGAQFPKAVILFAVFFYVRYAVSYRDLEEILTERGVQVDHATLNRWVTRYSPTSRPAGRMDSTPAGRPASSMTSAKT